ncbi:MAG: ParA family protein [Bdellovibrionales bacterium]|nr:ParA family protein [Bdellovibrionales bacterium]
MAIVSIINQKGGVAKTTSSINIAASWAKGGKKVLLIDLDPQGSATKSVFGDREFDVTIYDVLMSGKHSASDAIVHSDVFDIDMIPAEIMLSGIDIQLAAQYGRESFLKRKLKNIANDYDEILIDCSPSLGLLTINALMASKDIIIPICPEYFSLKGIELILETIKGIRTGLGHKVSIRGVVITRYRNRKIANKVIQEVGENYNLRVFEDYIPDSIMVEEAHHRHLPIFKYSPKNPAAVAYMNLAKGLLSK